MFKIGSLRLSPLFDVVDGGGGAGASGGGSNANGAGAGAGGGSPQGGQGGASGASGASAPYRLSDDSLITLEEGKEPIKFGEHVRGLKSQFTKASQERARIEKEHKALQAEHQRAQEQLKRFQEAAGGQGGGKADVYGKLKQLPYLTGEDAAEVIQNIESAISQRDQALVLMYKQLTDFKKELGGVSSRHQEQEFSKKIAGFREKLGLTEDYNDFLSELYSAYEGDDLDQEFPSIAQKRIEQLQKALRAADQKKVTEAKRLPFVPGKGGQGTPSRPLQDKMKKASAGDIADMVWDSLEETGS